MSRHPRAISAPLAKVMVGDCVLREGRARDAASIGMWSTYSLAEMETLASAAMHLDDEDGVGFVCIGPDGARVGLMIVEVPYLQFVHFIASARARGIANGLVVALVDHYFASETAEDAILAGPTLLATSRQVLDRLAFEGGRIDRATWKVRREQLLRSER